MTDYDFNIIEVVNHSTNSTNGYYWEEVKVDNGWINGKCIFCNTIGTGSKMRYKITYTNKDKGIIDEKNTFAKWYLDELKKSRGEDDDSSTSETTSESTTSESGSCCENLYRFIVQVVFTIIPILPIWWIFKFLLKGSLYCVKAVVYIITWPFRLLFCCCCNTDFLPKSEMPSYWFDMK